ncbi:LytTR family transcriptional regulator DNA-binding domain-containing protein [Paenibacillus sp. S29]|uniref:LytTR family transcriptional regulator DNA-binding domain-containing protein n=1 Tax=Paenibacillus sp. S29 TaxID=3394611 RepID=UPI0039BFD891
MDVGKILFVESRSHIHRILMHTFEGSFYTTGPLNYWEMLFNNEGYNFYNVDRSYTINVDALTGINEALKLAEFQDGQNYKKMTCTMAGFRYKKVASALVKLKPDIVFSN